MRSRMDRKTPMGRPPIELTPAMVEHVLVLAEQGKTDPQLAAALGVGVTTFKKWKTNYPEFAAALKVAKSAADDLVVRSLFERARGYSHAEEKVFCHEGVIITHKIVKHYPPDPVSMIFWLKNRQPDNWRDKQVLETEIKDSVAKLPDDELAAKAEEHLKAIRGGKA